MGLVFLKTSQCSIPLPPCEDTARSHQLWSRKRAPTRTWPCGYLDLGLTASRTVKKYISVFISSHSVIFYYSSPMINVVQSISWFCPEWQPILPWYGWGTGAWGWWGDRKMNAEKGSGKKSSKNTFSHNAWNELTHDRRAVFRTIFFGPFYTSEKSLKCHWRLVCRAMRFTVNRELILLVSSHLLKEKFPFHLV